MNKMSYPYADYTSNNTEICLIVRKNQTITNAYEGIPETLILNLISWVLLLLLFAVLRNRAWDYGRLALVHTEKWTQLFYKNTDDAVAVEETSGDVSLMPDTGCLWFPSIFKITKSKIYARCGPDATHYLSFQKHLLILFTIITIFSICVILPVNFQGNLEGNKTTFGHTTLSNLGPTSNLLWVHVIASLCMGPLAVLIMRKSSGKSPSSTALTSKTVMISYISKNQRNTEELKNYFVARYPGIDVVDIQITYRVKQLMNLERKRKKIHDAKVYCHENAQNADLKVQPYGCICCCPWKTVNALEYYTREEQRYNELVLAERRSSLARPLGIAFVTFATEDMAQNVIKSFEPDSLRHWHIVKAPTPSDINWENLEISSRNWYSKAIAINSILFLVLFFVTTPIIFVNIFNQLSTSHESFLNRISPLLSQFLPTLLLLSMSALMPVLVAYSDQLMSHWTKSKQNQAIMYKTFIFLLFMVLILPSLGLTSAQAFVEWSIQTENQTLRWKCIFLADKGAFFVNYIITSALIGTALELLRFPELAMYALRLSCIKSIAEKATIRKEILSEFPFGIHYAWTLLIFTISTVYSLSCPLITPFGLLYLCLKHLVDKYNIYFVYKPITMSSEGQQIHAGAVRMVRVAVVLCQVILAAFFFIRESGGMNLVTFVMLVGTCVTVFSFFFLSPFPSCESTPTAKSHSPVVKEQYIAPFLLSSGNIENHIDRSSPTLYGSSSQVIIIPETGSSNA
ncbi:transmembrane protein 63 [Rhynchophorus ferrugineus]|uniref:transmembrane protein 63 n=1 Tax=Rhynchophorus ferrugineus TaxID=354439 RepID=UPI003FCE411E